MNEPDSDYIQADYLPITPDESTSVSPCVSTSSPHGTGSETSNSSPVESIGYPNISCLVATAREVQKLLLSGVSPQETQISEYLKELQRVYHILVFDLDQNNQELKSLKKEISEILDIAEKVKELYEEDEKTEFNLVMRYTMYSYFPGEDSSSVREMCEDIVQRAIERVKLGQSCDIRSFLLKKKEKNRISRLDAYQKTTLNRWYSSGRVFNRRNEWKKATGLSDNQFKNWCANKRRRQRKKTEEVDCAKKCLNLLSQNVVIQPQTGS